MIDTFPVSSTWRSRRIAGLSPFQLTGTRQSQAYLRAVATGRHKPCCSQRKLVHAVLLRMNSSIMNGTIPGNLDGLVQDQRDAINDASGHRLKQTVFEPILRPVGCESNFHNRNWLENKPLMWDVTVSRARSSRRHRLAFEKVRDTISI